jgi:hypothetical protein
MLKEAIPAVSHVAVLVNTANPGMHSTLTHLEAAAPTLKLKLQILDVRAALEIEGRVRAWSHGRRIRSGFDSFRSVRTK